MTGYSDPEAGSRPPRRLDRALPLLIGERTPLIYNQFISSSVEFVGSLRAIMLLLTECFNRTEFATARGMENSVFFRCNH